MKDFFKKIGQFLGLTGILIVVALLGSVGGQGVKWTRRFLLPGIIMIYSFFIVHSFWVVTIYTMSIWLSMGYGISSENDDGSAIGRFWFKLCNGSELGANIMTRATIGNLIALSMLSIPIIKETWLSFLIGDMIIIGIWASISWRDFGVMPVTLFKKQYQLLKVDLITYGVTAIGLLIIIHGFFG